MPTFVYLKTMLVIQLRKGLRQVGYPSPEACAQLMQECEQQQESAYTNDNGQHCASSFEQMASAAEWLHRLQMEHRRVLSHVQGTSPVPSLAVDEVVLELCRPFVERIRYHFVVVQVQQQHSSNDRIERLPEWLFRYLRQHVFPQEQDGP